MSCYLCNHYDSWNHECKNTSCPFLPNIPWKETVYKAVAIGEDGRLYSIFDGSPWNLGIQREESVNEILHTGLFVYRDKKAVNLKEFPWESKLTHRPKAIVKCRTEGSCFRSPWYGLIGFDEGRPYDACKYGRQKVTPLNVEWIEGEER